MTTSIDERAGRITDGLFSLFQNNPNRYLIMDKIKQALLAERRLALQDAAKAVSYGKCADEIRLLIEKETK